MTVHEPSVYVEILRVKAARIAELEAQNAKYQAACEHLIRMEKLIGERDCRLCGKETYDNIDNHAPNCSILMAYYTLAGAEGEV